LPIEKGKSQIANRKSKLSLVRFAAAVLIYAGFAVYLYLPHFKNFHKLQYLLVINPCLASLGCFVLSRRWVSTFWASLFAGAVYGFGPFVLGLAKFHPTAGFLAATLPWLFCPAAFWPKGKWRWLSIPLSALPFVAILLFFQVSAYFGLFAVPIQARLHLADLAGLLAPLVMAKRNVTLVGFYHIPIAAMIAGLFMLLAARRLGTVAIFTLATVLAFCKSFLDISPVIWLTVPVLCCSILVGAGMQGLASAGFADKGWVLAVAAVMGGLSIVSLLLAAKYFQTILGLGKEYAVLFVSAACMYVLGAVALAIIFFMARAKLRITPLRWAILCSAMAVDIFFGARFIADKLFF